jgi:hypothetical protein
MFPPKQLIDMVELTNTELTKLELNKTNCSEMLKFFGVILLMTKFEFTSATGKLVVNCGPIKVSTCSHLTLASLGCLSTDLMTCSGQ